MITYSCFVLLSLVPALSQDGPAESPAKEPTPFAWAAAIADESPVVAAFVQHGELLVLQAETGEVLKSLDDPTPGAELWRLDVDASGDLVALLTRDNRVWLWRWREGDRPLAIATLPGALSSWKGHRFGAALEFGPHGKTLLAGHGAGGVLLIDREGKTRVTFGQKGAEAPAERDPEAGEWRAVYASGFDLPRAWSSSGNQIALVTAAGPGIFDAQTGEAIATGFDVPEGALHSLALDPEGAQLVTGHYGGIIVLHDVESKAQRWTYAFVDPVWGGHDPAWNPTGVGDIEFSPDGGLVAATVNSAIHALLLDAKSGESLWIGPFCGGRMGEPAALAWAPDGRGFFHAYVSGVMPLQHVRLQEKENRGFAGQLERERGTLPDIGWNGFGVYVTRDAIRVVDPVAWKPVWTKSVE